MATEAEKAAADKLLQEQAAAKKTADELAAAANAAAAATWPNGGYNLLIPFIFVSVYAMFTVYVDVLNICVVSVCMVRDQYVSNLACAMFMIYMWIKLIGKLLIYPTI